MRRMRRLTPEGMALLGIVLFVLLAVLYPAITVLTRGAPPTAGQPGTGSPGSPDFEVIGKKKETNPTIEVWLDGTLTEMKLEDYLIGFAAEMRLVREALKAQAVAAHLHALQGDHGGNRPRRRGYCATATIARRMSQREMIKRGRKSGDRQIPKPSPPPQEAIYYEGETIQYSVLRRRDRTEDSENVICAALPSEV